MPAQPPRTTPWSWPGPAGAGDPRFGARAFLLVHTDGAPPVRFDLGGALISIGRASDNDVIVDDPEVSRHHCQLKLQHGAYSLADLGSRNGSWINGQPVNEVALGPGRHDPDRQHRDRIPGRLMTGEVLRILLLVLQLGFLALLYLILIGFSRALLRDLRSAEVTQMASQSGIGRLAVVESPDDEPALGIGPSPLDQSTPSAGTSTAPSSSTTTS